MILGIDEDKWPTPEAKQEALLRVGKALITCAQMREAGGREGLEIMVDKFDGPEYLMAYRELQGAVRAYEALHEGRV